MHSAVPDQVSGVRFAPSPNENSLSVEWSRPQSDLPILYYEIRFRHLAGTQSWQGPVRATTESVILRGSLRLSTSYGVEVRAVSGIGMGLYSTEKTLKRLFQHTAYTYLHTYPHNLHTHAYTHTSWCA